MSVSPCMHLRAYNPCMAANAWRYCAVTLFFTSTMSNRIIVEGTAWTKNSVELQYNSIIIYVDQRLYKNMVLHPASSNACVLWSCMCVVVWSNPPIAILTLPNC